jgi:hypothetical protein
VPDDTIQIEKENITSIEENIEPKSEEVDIDATTKGTDLPLTPKRGFPNRKSNKIETLFSAKYTYKKEKGDNVYDVEEADMNFVGCPIN